MPKQQSTTTKQKVHDGQNGREVSSYEQELTDYLQERIKPGLNRGAIPLLARSIAKELARHRPSEDAEVDDESIAETDDHYSDDVDDESVAEADDDDSEDLDEDDEPTAEADDDDSEDLDEDDEPTAETDDDDSEDLDEDDEPTAEADDDDSEDLDEDDEPTAEADDDDSEDLDEDDDDEPTAETDDDDSEDLDEDDEPTAEADDDAEDDGPPDFQADMQELQAEFGDDWILRFSVQGEDSWLTAEKDDGSQRVEAPTASVLSEAVELLNESGGRSA